MIPEKEPARLSEPGGNGATANHPVYHPHTNGSRPVQSTRFVLRPYQQEALAAIEEASARGVQRQCVAQPTGSGKTVVFSELVNRRPGRALVLAHRDELIRQAEEKIRMAGAAANIGIVKAERDEHTAPIVLASVQTIARPQRLFRIVPDFTTVIVDEAHHATATSYRRILEYVGSFREGGPLTVGFTATPQRGDGQGLDSVFQEIVHETSMIDLMRKGYLSDLRAVQVRLNVDFNDLHTRAGDFIEAEVGEMLSAANAPEHVVAAYQRHAAGRKALVFTPTVAVAYEMARTFRAGGTAAEALDGSTPRNERQAILARFHSGETQVIANCTVLTEGFDEASIACIILARPTKSQPFYQQMIGRGTRTYPGKADCLVLDVVGSTTRHDLVTAATLFGVEESALRAGTIGEAVAEKEQAEQKRAQRGELVARAVDLFERKNLAWTAAEGGRYSLSTGKSLIVLSLEGERWNVRELVQGAGQRVLGQGLDLGYAQGIAEDRARELGAGALMQRDAPWRQKPASEKQRAALRRWRIPPPPGLTSGEASDLLQGAIAGAQR